MRVLSSPLPRLATLATLSTKVPKGRGNCRQLMQHRTTLSPRSKLFEIVNAELFLDGRHLVNAALEPFIAQYFLLSFFHAVTQGSHPVRREKLPECRKQHGVFT